MKIIKREQSHYILRIDKGEDFIDSLKMFCKKEGIHAGWFTAVGAAEKAELAYYEPVKKQYHSKKINERLEIVNITGNVTLLDNEISIHAHGTLGTKDMELLGGHINSLVISTIAEVHLRVFEGDITKKPSEEIGLNIMD